MEGLVQQLKEMMDEFNGYIRRITESLENDSLLLTEGDKDRILNTIADYSGPLKKL